MKDEELQLLLKEAVWQTYQKYFPDLLEESLEDCKIEIHFDLEKEASGMANGSDIHFNLTLCRENLVRFFGVTVPHETAHLIDFRVNGSSSHGENWKAIMFRLGITNPETHHSYDTSNVDRGRKNYCYECQSCHYKYWVTERMSKKVESAGSYHCKCKGKLVLASSAYDALDD